MKKKVYNLWASSLELRITPENKFKHDVNQMFIIPNDKEVDPEHVCKHLFLYVRLI